MRFFLLLLAATSWPADAQVYRWTDANGTVHYSNAAPPAGVKAVTVDIEAKPGAPSPDTQDCYTVRCQGERMEQRIAARDAADSRAAAERVARTPPQPRGLEFRRYVSIQRGMTLGEMTGVAGAPDLVYRERDFMTYSYLPTVADPFTTTITLVRGRVSEIERARKF
jgi:hypothetical protein